MRHSIILAFTIMVSPPAAAQHGAAPARTPPAAARQFDFLIGQWELSIKPKATSLAARLHGAPRLVGVWKAWGALDGWGVEDELRIIDASGNPVSLVYALRAFDPSANAWNQNAYDVYRARFTPATARWADGEMVVTSRGKDPDGTSYLLRMRFHDIGATGFKVQQDRSRDDGKTWERGVLVIEATRLAATAPR